MQKDFFQNLNGMIFISKLFFMVGNFAQQGDVMELFVKFAKLVIQKGSSLLRQKNDYLILAIAFIWSGDVPQQPPTI